MSALAQAKGATRAENIVTRERLYGSPTRWRRFGEPTPAGASSKEDGTPDYGVFGPGTVAWQVLLHPATIVFQFAFQQKLQLTYKPITAGIRDRDPISRKAHQGTLNIFDVFERAQRNCGIHAPMWLADTASARRVAHHIRNIHAKVAGDVIDVSNPELGGYAANSPRDSMWAALTEMHSMLWLYESFAFRDGKAPHPLSDEERDQFVAEVAEYCRLFDSPEDEIPTTMAELEDLYAKYDEYFQPSPTLWVDPATGTDLTHLMGEAMGRNRHHTQRWVERPVAALFYRYDDAIDGAFPPAYRKFLGLTKEQDAQATRALTEKLGGIRRMQGPHSERRYTELMWGPDATLLIENARRLHEEAIRERAA